MAKHITYADALSEIKDEEYFFPRGDVTTICVLTLQNGRQVASVVFGQSPATYDLEIGKQKAHEKAVKEIFPLLVYRAHCEIEQDASA